MDDGDEMYPTHQHWFLSSTFPLLLLLYSPFSILLIVHTYTDTHTLIYLHFCCFFYFYLCVLAYVLLGVKETRREGEGRQRSLLDVFEVH